MILIHIVYIICLLHHLQTSQDSHHDFIICSHGPTSSSSPLVSPIPSFPSAETHNFDSVSSTAPYTPNSDSSIDSLLFIHLLFQLGHPPDLLNLPLTFNYHFNLASSLPPSDLTSVSTLHLIQNTLSYSHFSASHITFTLAISTPVEPNSIMKLLGLLNDVMLCLRSLRH
ncbi:hypothetical protein FCV25MIE_28465 [Fagus crenata]